MSNILITGGAGFIGSSLAEKLSEDGKNEIIIVDSLLTGNLNNIPDRSNVRFIKADVNVYEQIAPIMISNKFDYVYHYAAVVGVERTIQNPLLVLEDIKGIENVLMLCKSTSVKKILYASSSEVYGEPVEIPLSEETSPLNAKLPYAVVKNIGECYVRSFQEEHGLEFTIFRFFNTYGPKQTSDFVMTKFIKAAIAGNDITVYGDGSQSRTFCYITDNLEATTNALTDRASTNKTYNIGSSTQISILDLAKTIIKVTDSKSKIIYLPALEKGDMTRRQPETTLMKELLGHPTISLEDGLRHIIESMK